MTTPATPSAIPLPPTAAPARFPLHVAIGGIVASGAALLVCAAGGHWGAAPHAGDALGFAWHYVNVALIWTWLAVWPAISLSQTSSSRRSLVWEFAVLLLVFIPAFSVAAFLSAVPVRIAWEMAALQCSVGLLTAGALAWSAFSGAGFSAGILATLAFVAPVAAYFWAEFFPLASQAWRAFIPVIAAARASHLITPATWWAAAVYALLGLILWATAPGRSPRA